MKRTIKKIISSFIIFSLLLTFSYIPESVGAASLSSTSIAFFRLLDSNTARPIPGKKAPSSKYKVVGTGIINPGTAYSQVESKVVTYPNLSGVSLYYFQTIEWYSITRDYLLWKVDGQIVNKPEGTVIDAQFRILNDNVSMSSQGTFASSDKYKNLGFGKVKLATVYGSNAYEKIVSTPSTSSVISGKDKIYWYNIGQDNDTWVVEGIIIRASTDNNSGNNSNRQSSNGSSSGSTSNDTAQTGSNTSNSGSAVSIVSSSSGNSGGSGSNNSGSSVNVVSTPTATSISTPPISPDAIVSTGNTAPTVIPIDTSTPQQDDVPEVADPVNTNEEDYSDYVNIKDMGAKGDGITDDSDVINTVLKSGATKVYFPKGNYKCKKRIDLHDVHNLDICGDGAESIIMTTSDYKGSDTPDENFFTVWGCSNISFKKICFKACEKWTVNYSRQVSVYYSDGISFESCSFIVPPTVKKDGPNTDREYTNLAFYTGWKNVTVNNCYFEQLGGVERGCNLIFTDIWNAGCENATITNNTFEHNAHDEMFSLFGGKENTSYMRHIKVSNNVFNAKYTNEVSARTMCFTFAYDDSKNVSDVSFTGNTVNAVTPQSLMTFGVIDKCDVSYNVINVTNNTDYNTGIVFSGADNVYVHDNNITVDGKGKEGMAIIACGEMLFSHNVVTVNASMRYLFSETTITDNDIKINAHAESVAQAPKYMKNNSIDMNACVDNFISYIKISLEYDSDVSDNVFNYYYNDKNDDALFITGNAVYVNIGTALNGHKVSFTGNTIYAPNVNTFRKNLLAYCVTDQNAQTFIIKNNTSDSYKDCVYLCEGTQANIITK